MNHPRLSIIPAGAVTDARLEPRDLQVLCLLGRHIDNRGWCLRSQVKMARELGCGRSTVQRSLERLEKAGWIDRERKVRESGADAAHAYRVILDVADALLGPDDLDADLDAEAAAPVDNPVDNPVEKPQGGVPTSGQGVPTSGQGVPTHGRAPMLTTPVKREERDGAQARTVPVEKFLRKWPTAATDNRANIEREWAGLDDGGRQAAIDGVDRYIAELRKNGRKHTPAGGTYLKNRGWEGLPPAPDGPERIAFKNLSRTWWAVVLRKIERGKRPGYMVTHANENPGKDWSAAGDDIPSAAEIDRLVAVSSNAPAFAAWLAWLENHGVHIDLWRTGGTFWIWVPGPEPPGIEAAKRAEPSPEPSPGDLAEFLKS